MRSVLLFFVLLLSSCAGGAAGRRSVPSVVVRVWWARSVGVDAAARERREVRGELRAVWEGPAPPAPVGTGSVVRAPPAALGRPGVARASPARWPPPCLSRALCAWERRARTRALARLLAEVGS